MKPIAKFVVTLGLSVLTPGFALQAQNTSAARHKELTLWQSAKLGSHIGGGYASTYLTNIRAKTIAQEDPELRQAINSLDGLGMMEVRGFGLVPAAVSWQTDIPIHTLVREQADTNLSYAELLMVHALAAKSGRNVGDVISIRARSGTWGETAKQLQVDPDLIITKAKMASTRIKLAEFSTRRRPPREGGTNFTSVNPHAAQQAVHH
jgi:hypothetical protein